MLVPPLPCVSSVSISFDNPDLTLPLDTPLSETGAEMLYVNPNFGRFVQAADGNPMDEAASDALLAQLYAQSHFPEYQAFFTYEEGSLSFWDNRACMHRATVDFSGSERAMRRVTVQGTGPPFWKAAAAATDAVGTPSVTIAKL